MPHGCLHVDHDALEHALVHERERGACLHVGHDALVHEGEKGACLHVGHDALEYGLGDMGKVHVHEINIALVGEITQPL